MTVPKIIHQIWHTFTDPYPPCKNAPSGQDAPSGWRSSKDKWVEKNPDWDHMMWNEKDSRDLIATHYSWFLKFYDNYVYPIQRVDAARYFILYHYGGVYIDMDMFPSENNLDDYIITTNISTPDKFNPLLYVLQVNTLIDFCVFNNAFIGCPKGSPVMRNIILQLLKPIPYWAIFYQHVIFTSTGPICLTKGIKASNNRNIVLLPNNIVIDSTKNSWFGEDSIIIDFISKYYMIIIVICIIIIIIIYIKKRRI